MTLQGVERKVALCSLLEQETKLISSIEEHRAAAREDGREQAVISLLDKVRGRCSNCSNDGDLTVVQFVVTVG